DRDFFRRLHPYTSEAAQVKYLARVEAALAEVLAEAGVCPAEAAAEIGRAWAAVPPEGVYEGGARLPPNIRAPVHLGPNKGRPPARPYVHLFATSADIMDSARALCLREVTRDVLLPGLIALTQRVLRLARDHAATPQMGRTHGQHAVPITFGFAMALYVS